MFKPPIPEPVTIAGPAGALQARVEDPAPGARPRAVGVLCHPHPLHGGTMDNKVVHTAARAMHEVGVPTVRFNFRGVGASEGTHDHGRGECDDALAVADWARRRWDVAALWLAGFSFGAAVAVQIAARAGCERLVTIAPPVSRLGGPPPQRPRGAWLVVQGSDDALVDAAAVAAWAAGYAPAAELLVIEGADHFFHGHITGLRRELVAFLAGEKKPGRLVPPRP